MALTTLEADTIRNAAIVARKIEQIKAILDEMTITYNQATVGLISTITQQNLDDATQFSGITKAQLDDAMYAMTNGVKTAIANSATQIANLANRSTDKFYL